MSLTEPIIKAIIFGIVIACMRLSLTLAYDVGIICILYSLFVSNANRKYILPVIWIKQEPKNIEYFHLR